MSMNMSEFATFEIRRREAAIQEHRREQSKMLLALIGEMLIKNNVSNRSQIGVRLIRNEFAEKPTFEVELITAKEISNKDEVTNMIQDLFDDFNYIFEGVNGFASIYIDVDTYINFETP